ncbi:hypothetical protein AHiyo1_20530 [Arthrobacter sp. Hiyo1]|nr:hypothetical protein AHiyo1_20530 [Arthrobacter sp. Hiyo1]
MTAEWDGWNVGADIGEPFGVPRGALRAMLAEGGGGNYA